MKIEKLMIYGYGRFEQQSIGFNQSQLQIIYGENEAGKSTVMSFIHSILFGFPTKQQTENRYEPKMGTAYGGYLLIRNKDQSLIKIERLPGKAGGVVKVEEDHSILGEDYVQILLSGIDRDTYRSIFSFDVHGLQQVQKMDANQIGKFLFLSSIYGADALFTIEQILIKQQEQLYKPSGKRPILNESLARLKESQGQLLDAKRKNNEYQILLTRRNELKEQLRILATSKKENLDKQRKLEKIQSVIPLARERNWCKEQLRQLPDTSSFPENGLKLLDQFNVALQPLEAQIHSLKSKYQQFQLEEKELVVNQNIIDCLPAINTLREQLPLYKEKGTDHKQKEQQIEQLDQEVTVYKQRLFPYLSEEEISKITATIPMKEAIKKVLAEYQHVNQRKKVLDDQFDQIKNLLEDNEYKISELEHDGLTEEERKSLDQEISKREATNPALQRDEYQKTVTEIHSRKKEHKQEKRQRILLISTLSLFLLFGTVWFIVDLNWFFVCLVSIGLIIAILQLIKVIKGEDRLIDHLESKLETLKSEITALETQDTKGRSMSELLLQLEKDNKIKQALHHEKLLHKQHERTYDRILKLYEEWEDDQFHCKEKAVNLAKQLQLDSQTSPEALLEAHELTQHIQQLILRKRQVVNEVKVIMQERLHYEAAVGSALETCKLKIESIEEAVYELTKRTRLESTNHEKLQEKKQRKDEVAVEIKELSDKIEYMQNEKHQLMKKISVENEDEFRRFATIHQQRQELTKQLLWVEKQLVTGNNGNIDNLLVENYENIEDQLIELEGVIEKDEQQEKELRHEFSSVVIKIQEMEQNGTYSNLLHAFEAEKTVVKEYAEQWVVRALAKDILNKTVERYRKEKLPALLAHIEKYFKKLTSSKYNHVFLPDNKQSFIVEREDGMRFYAEELSQATAEQLYLSIRLALVKTINEHVNLPIMIDDSFVHFDHHRTANMMQVLEELKQENQVIYFTCHKHIAHEFKTDHLIDLTELHVK